MIRVFIKASSRYPVDRKRICKIIKKLLGELGSDKEVEVSILFAGDRKVRQINSLYRNVDSTTDVLSFSYTDTKFPDGVLRLGDIIISYPQAGKQARQYNITCEEEIDKLIKHGLLSLLGLHNNQY